MGIYFGGNGFYPQTPPPYSEFPLWFITSSGPIPSNSVTFQQDINTGDNSWINIVDWISQQIGNDDWLSIELPTFPYFVYDVFQYTLGKIFPSLNNTIFIPPLNLERPENPLYNQSVSLYTSSKIFTKLISPGTYGNEIPDFLATRQQRVTVHTDYETVVTTCTCGSGYPNENTPFGYMIQSDGDVDRDIRKKYNAGTTKDASIIIPIFPKSWINKNKINPAGTFDQYGNFTPTEIPGQLLIEFSGRNNSGTCFVTYGRARNYNFSKKYYDYLAGLSLSGIDSDPYKPGGTSGGGGGSGSFQTTSTPVSLPGLPSIQVTDTGFLTLYNPTVTQIKALASYMWSTGFSLDDFKKIFADPISAIIGLQLLPVSIPNSSAVEVKIGNIATGVSMFPVTSQWVTHSCGRITIPEFWGAYLDFNPYTKLQIFLPYIGIRDLNADDIIGKSLQLQYNVDALSGACVASLACGGTTLYNWQGSCGLQIPFTSNTFSNLLGSILQVAGAGVAIAGASSIGAVAAAGLSAASGTANAMKNDIQHGGNSSGAGGFLGIQTPYIILSRPRLCRPAEQNKYIGYPSFINVALSDITGFTRVEEIHIENVPATAAELEEIESLLKSGVFF